MTIPSIAGTARPPWKEKPIYKKINNKLLKIKLMILRKHQHNLSLNDELPSKHQEVSHARNLSVTSMVGRDQRFHDRSEELYPIPKYQNQNIAIQYLHL